MEFLLPPVEESHQILRENQYVVPSIISSSRLNVADGHLMALELEISRLKSIKKGLQDRRNAYSSLHAPIRRLPIEILHLIFHFACSRTPFNVEYDPTEYPINLSALNISVVCHYWREISLQMSDLWSVIELGMYRHMSSEQQLLRAKSVSLYLSRSASRPLSITLAMPHRNPTDKVLHVLAGHSERWQHVNMWTHTRNFSHILGIGRRINGHLSRLESLQIVGQCDSEEIQLGTDCFDNCPRLSTLHVYWTHPDSFTFPYHRLTTMDLFLRRVEALLLSDFSRRGNLRNLTIRCNTLNPEAFHEPIIFPKLESLEVIFGSHRVVAERMEFPAHLFGRLIYSLDMPILASLTLRCLATGARQMWKYGDHREFMISLEKHKTLESLMLYDCSNLPMSMVLDILEALPSLKKLDIRDPPLYLVNANYTSYTMLFEAIGPRPDPILPNLQELHLRLMFSFPEKLLLELIAGWKLPKMSITARTNGVSKWFLDEIHCLRRDKGRHIELYLI